MRATGPHNVASRELVTLTSQQFRLERDATAAAAAFRRYVSYYLCFRDFTLYTAEMLASLFNWTGKRLEA